MLAVKEIDALLKAGEKCERRDKSNGRGFGTLVLRVLGKMKGEWYLRWTVEGYTRYHLICSAGTNGHNLKEARGQYDDLSVLVKDGKNPRVEKERLKYEERLKELERSKKGTIKDLFTAYVDNLEAAGKPSAYDVKMALLNGEYAVIKCLGENVLARDVTPQQIKRCLHSVYHERNAKAMADRIRSYIKTAFNFGMKHEFDYRKPEKEILFDVKSNPVEAIPADIDVRRVGERFLSPEELRAFWTEPVRLGMNPRFHCALKLIIAIGGVRVQEVVGAVKSEFDIDKSLFYIPEARTKNGLGHLLPLSLIAEELIEEALLIGVPDSPFLFPSCSKRLEMIQPFTFTSLNKPLSDFCNKLGITPWTPRDLRRTVRTMLEDEALGEEYIDIYFNHGVKNSVGRKHYNRSDMLKMKNSVALCWENKLANILWG